LTPIPFLLVSDGPAEATGLGRIARDLGGILSQSGFPIDFVQLGGTTPPVWLGWRHYPLDRRDDWGASHTAEYYRDLFGSEPGIVWVVWDPARLFHFAQLDLPVQLWSYPAIDAANMHDQISGPARVGLDRADRILGYGRFGARILKNTLPDWKVGYLPHGISTGSYAALPSEDEQAWVRSILGQHYREHQHLIGCVATNQPRKDLSLFTRALRILLNRGEKVYGWLHTDVLVKSWAVQQLIEDAGLQKHLTVTLDNFSDRNLALLYQRCAATIAPGLGEGFGYPLVESLAAGTPVVHGDFGGGAELVPKTEWRVPVRSTRLESVYALVRPVFFAEDFANATMRAIGWRQQVGELVCRGYCQGAVAHLEWGQLQGRWQSWIRKGL
jgi:glycosyltransferase involved in cell wall biosynthesis